MSCNHAEKLKKIAEEARKSITKEFITSFLVEASESARQGNNFIIKQELSDIEIKSLEEEGFIVEFRSSTSSTRTVSGRYKISW